MQHSIATHETRDIRMNIDLTISTDCLGDNTEAQNSSRYIEAVRAAIQAEYPSADLSVDLITDVSIGKCLVDDDPTGEVEECINAICNDVWNQSNY